MKNIILCEGGTDLALIQYFMEKANNWEYKDTKKEITYFKDVRNLKKNGNTLTVASAGGCSKIAKCFEGVIEKNVNSSLKDELFDNIIIISDRDEVNTIDDFEKAIIDCLRINGIDITVDIINDEWIDLKAINGKQEEIKFRVLLLIIPFEETGAIETFLLNAIAEGDEYDKYIISKGNKFVDTVDKEGRYLRKRRHKTKAKFDVYFSIRTSVEQFTERKNILKNIPWEDYKKIQESFKKLSDI
ncbi:MAG: DUF3226 domain-containing protein [Clostridium sp.]